MIRVRCEICEEIIASADEATLKAPMDSTMFDAPEAGFDPPWLDPVPWLHLYCPYCRKRAFQSDDRVWLEDRTYRMLPLKADAIEPEIDAMAKVIGGEEPEESLEDAIKRLSREPLTPTEIGNQLGVTRQKVTAVLRRG